MPIFFILVGAILLTTGVRGNTAQFFTLFASDFKAFLAWFFLIIVIGFVGISKTLRPASNAFLFLIILVFILKNGPQAISNFNTTISSSS